MYSLALISLSFHLIISKLLIIKVFDHLFRYKINVTNNKTKPEQIKRYGLRNSFNRLETIIKPIILNDIEAINKTVKNRCLIYGRRGNWYNCNQPRYIK